MFRRLNLYLFAGFVFSLKIALLIAVTFALGMTALTPFTGGGLLFTPIFVVSGIAATSGFLSCLAAFFFIMSSKLWGFKISRSTEGYWVLSLAAFLTNAWLLLNYDREFLSIYILMLFISIGIILLGNRFYQTSMNKLDRLLAE